jgi:hypothetical protein
MEQNLAFCKTVTFRLKYKLSEHDLNYRKEKLKIYTKGQLFSTRNADGKMINTS